MLASWFAASFSAAAQPPPQLLPARMQMAFTLGTHIILACLGVAFPLVVLIANWYALRKDDPVALLLAKRWSKVMAVVFAVGAVTGTVLSFEMGLLWPRMLGQFGDVFGFPFAVEGIFFFLEAIFIAIYIYGWKRLSPKVHLWTAVPVVIAGIGGTVSVVAANAWMNHPAGFTMTPSGELTNVDPMAAMFNAGTGYQGLHMLLAAYMVTGFLVASVYAVGWMKGRKDRYHRLGFVIPFAIAAICTPIQIIVGDTAARQVFSKQPTKFAAMELVWKTGPNQPEYIGGILNEETGEVTGAIAIPGLNSILAGFSVNTVVQGLSEVPPEDRPPANVVHLAFDTMVGLGSLLLLLSGWFGFVYWRKRDLPKSKLFWLLAAASGVMAITAMEAGWIVTEVGRQPWIVYGIMRTEEAVTDAEGVWISFGVFVTLYAVVALGTVVVLRGMSRRWRETSDLDDIEDTDVPYGPRHAHEPHESEPG